MANDHRFATKRVRYSYPPNLVEAVAHLARAQGCVRVARLVHLPRETISRWMGDTSPGRKKTDYSRIVQLCKTIECGFEKIVEPMLSLAISLEALEGISRCVDRRSLVVASQGAESAPSSLKRRSTLSYDRSGDAPMLYHRVKAYLEAHYNEQISIEHVASVFHLNKFSLIRAFKRYFGQSPYQYVLLLRVEKADAALRKSFLRIPDIAMMVGFGTEAAMTRAFRKFHGRTAGCIPLPLKHNGSVARTTRRVTTRPLSE